MGEVMNERTEQDMVVMYNVLRRSAFSKRKTTLMKETGWAKYRIDQTLCELRRGKHAYLYKHKYWGVDSSTPPVVPHFHTYHLVSAGWKTNVFACTCGITKRDPIEK